MIFRVIGSLIYNLKPQIVVPMSGRMLKRALKEQQAHPSNESIEENGLAQSEDEEENHVEKPIRNMFDLLGAQAMSPKPYPSNFFHYLSDGIIGMVIV